MKGEVGTRYEYNRDSRLYKKVLLDIKNVSSIGFDQRLYFNISDIVTFSESKSRKTGSDLKANGDRLKQVEFYIGYQTADMICYTRKSDDTSSFARVYEELIMDWEEFSKWMYADSELSIYIHSPQQLWRSETPKFWTKFSDIKGENDFDNYEHNIRLQMSQITVVRKRPNSNDPCDALLHDDDRKLQRKIAKHIGCVPPYWKTTLVNSSEFDQCQNAQQLKAANHYIEHYGEKVMGSYSGPCMDMGIISTAEWQIREIRRIDDYFGRNIVRLRFEYMEKYYLEILNSQEFAFESVFSAVGGFLGIFMGYSMLQLPEFIDYLYLVLRNIKI